MHLTALMKETWDHPRIIKHHICRIAKIGKLLKMMYVGAHNKKESDCCKSFYGPEIDMH